MYNPYKYNSLNFVIPFDCTHDKNWIPGPILLSQYDTCTVVLQGARAHSTVIKMKTIAVTTERDQCKEKAYSIQPHTSFIQHLGGKVEHGLYFLCHTICSDQG